MSDEQFYKELQGDFYKESLDLIERFELVLLNNEHLSNENINELFRIAHTIKGGSAAVGLSEISTYTHKVEDFLSQYKNKCELFTKKTVSLFLEFSDILRTEFIAQISEMPAPWDPSGHLERIRNFSDDSSENSVCTPVEIEHTPAASISPASDSTSNSATKSKKMAIQVKVDNDRLDGIFNTIGEVVIMKNQMKEHLLRNLNDSASVSLSESLDFIIKDLYDKALGLRLTSIQPMLQRLQRTLRDLSVQLKKEVQVVISGEDTEIDRTLFDALSEPLIHLVRNAIDHGIESAEERQQANKQEKALIQIKAYYLSGQVVIEITDNGRGVDQERVFLKCKMKELIPETAKMSDYTEDQIHNFLMLPGFSTTENVTDISGRGVGLDVVRTTVEKMLGKISIKSKKGEGTTFLLFLPMTTSLIDGIVFEVNQSRYIVPVNSIKSIIQITKAQITHAPGGELFLNHLQRPVRVINLDHFLSGNSSVEKENYVAVISDINGVQTAFLFDEVQNQAQAVVKPLSDVQKRPEYIGAAVLGDGFTYLILDLISIHLNTETQKSYDTKVVLKKEYAA
ncbi:MAG: hypothetical protein A2622_00610 [Bdellovibrionales bacterium RIFCSPHIGHO2_01_FULL_40_29]|nr:MAG: hypothetical protein A2622_00610 [Bdellovibrionales bacterium RIFCSPHIGHO2_01_FULL_40_29]OFZ32623.1 MAG: hypothetical protein A3D17_05210 [Bdellovibrionales bacterium RIFCSPHIGHO2_02_FULL_40_15]